MQETVRAIYRNGAFVPIVPCNLPNETEVEVVVQHEPRIIPPQVTDPKEQARIRTEVIARMRNNPIPANAPKFTREDLHERR
jgi:predicted DNA-binding antitoxin AbrB/MazE fold protein